MATFATKDTNTTDIDPEALTVNLLGPKPDPDDLVITAPNVKPVADDPVSDNPEDNESIDKILKAQNTPVERPSDDEEEIKAIEEMLRSNKSTRMKKQKEAGMKSEKPAGKKGIDPIVVVSAIVAAILIFVFIAFFTGMFNSSSTLKMTLKEFSAAYAKTDAYEAISGYGFAFPEVAYDEETAGTDSASSSDSDVRTFSGYLDNTVNYQLAVSGSVNKSDDNIKALRVAMLLSNSSAFNELLVIFAPYVQVLYPEMTTLEATTYLSDIYTSEDPVTVRGNYGLALDTGSVGTTFYCTLDIVSSKDASALAADITAEDAAASLAAVTPAATTAAS